MIKLKTNIPVIVNPRSEWESVVYMSIIKVEYYGDKYSVLVGYHWIDDIITPFGTKHIKKELPTSVVNFTKTQAQAIETGSGGLTGSTFSDKFDSLIIAGIMYQLGVAPAYGLDHTGWIII